MRSPIRVGVWGTGHLGGALIREVHRRESLELVGVLSYSADKAGRDAGEVIDVGPLGVTVTTDPEELISQEPEVVLHVPMDLGGDTADADILNLLGAGINVITALPYRDLRYRGDSAFARFQEQAEKGDATFYVAGVNPDFVLETLVLTLTGVCSYVEHIHVQEIFRGDTIGRLMFEVACFGKPREAFESSDVLLDLGGRYFVPSMRITAERMGRPLDRVDGKSLITTAPEDIDIGFTTIEAGTIATLGLRWDGYVDDEIFFTFEGTYYCGHTMRPPQAVADECWLVDIEGRPSLRTAVESLASVNRGTMHYDGDPTQPGYYVTAAPMIQAVPVVVSAPPGVKENEGPAIHYHH